MPGIQLDDLMADLLREIEGYLPNMRLNLHVLKTNHDNKQALNEFHRMSHTIQSLSSMAELDELSKTASVLEKIMEKTIDFTVELNPEIIKCMLETTDRMISYCTAVHDNSHRENNIYSETLTAFNRIDSDLFSFLQDNEGTSIPLQTEETHFDGESSVHLEDIPRHLLSGNKHVEPDQKLHGQSYLDTDETIFDLEEQHLPNDTSPDQLTTFPEINDADIDDLFDDSLLESDQDLFDQDDNEPATTDTPPIDPELMESFNAEASEHLEEIFTHLNSLSTTITAQTPISEKLKNQLHVIRRAVHTLKGASAVIGIQQVADWGHIFEDFLDWLHDESPIISPEIVSILLKGSDLTEILTNDHSSPITNEKAFLELKFQEIINETESTHDNPQPVLHDSKEGETEYLSNRTASSIESNLSTQDKREPSSNGDDSSIDPELQESFNEEAAEHLEKIFGHLNRLSTTITTQTPISDDLRKHLHIIRRSVHTLKGASAVIGIQQVADWGHIFEDFLDWLHDESSSINPEIVSSLLSSSDVLEKLVHTPNDHVSDETNSILRNIRKMIGAEPASMTEAADIVSQQPKKEPNKPIRITRQNLAEPTRTKKKKGQKTTTLRVIVEKVDRMVGFSGDMAINLSTFENSSTVMTDTLSELSIILKRLKNINTNLEAGYELSTIPHLGSMASNEQTDITSDFDPLEMDRYSELNILIRSLSEAVVDLESIMQQTVTVNDSWRKGVERQRDLLREIQTSLFDIRMTPLASLSSRLYRTVRETEKSTGHKARLIIEGESLMMDTRVWDTMADPLMHILRNAVSHGGKPDPANSQLENSPKDNFTIHIHGSRRGNQCLLRISDNGRGLDYKAIREKGIKLYPQDSVEKMSNEELAQLIFRHGFSSSSTITNISGRGVGMDVVRNSIEKLNGTIDVTSVEGQGLELIIKLPIAVAQLSAVLVRFDNHICAIPMRDIRHVSRNNRVGIIADEYEWEGEMLSLFRPSNILNFNKSNLEFPAIKSPERDSAILYVDAAGKRGVLLCDEIIEQREIIFKDLGSHLGTIPCIAGVTILGDGRLVPIIQTEDLLSDIKVSSGRSSQQQAPITEETRVMQILIADDSISVRKVLSNFITQNGWAPVTARDGIEAIETIRKEKPNLVLLDIEMPRMNGFEVLQALQAQPTYRDIPVVILSSRSSEKYRNKASGLGAKGFMTKPFQEEELSEMITNLTKN